MSTDYVYLPIGKISTKQLSSWLSWVGGKNYDNFASFPAVVEFFSEINKKKGLKSEELAGSFQENMFTDPKDFLKEKILFYVRFKLFSLIDTSAHLWVKFLCDGTVEISDVYLDDSENNELIRANVMNIARIIKLKVDEAGETKRMSWGDFKRILLEIELGHNYAILEIPNFT
jgi:hypothetical protein